MKVFYDVFLVVPFAAMIDRECRNDEQCHQHTNHTVCVQVRKTIYFPLMSEIQTFPSENKTHGRQHLA